MYNLAFIYFTVALIENSYSNFIGKGGKTQRDNSLPYCPYFLLLFFQSCC